MNKIKGTNDAWEDRKLGADENHVQPASPEHLSALDEALGLQAISIRLPKQLIDTYKLIAAHHGVGYQPLMRDILQRFAPEGLREVLKEQEKKANEAIDHFPDLRKVA